VTEAIDIEKLVGDLEIAVDRLRSLYEQYFMGIEKLEPMVPRKDVDRRIHILRKEQIRNTALRFRFQMVLQRYNTYQTHWMRICREIENGTYKRHVIRALQRFGTGISRASTRPPPGVEVAAETPASARASIPGPATGLSAELEAELAELEREFAPPDELDELDVQLVEEPTRPMPPAPRTIPAAPASSPAPVWRKVAAPASSAGASPPVPPLRPPPTSTALRAAAPLSSRQPPPAPAAPSTGLRAAPPASPTTAPTPRSAAAQSAIGRSTAGPPPNSTPLRAAPPRPTAAPGPDDLPDDRVRALYAQYVDAKRRQHESTAAITYDAVAKSLRDSSAKLREKHGRPVDFEVAVKDGKAILKPVLK
jgi:hypothetical protein